MWQEGYNHKERFIIRTQLTVTIHSYRGTLQADTSGKLSHQLYTVSLSFFASFSLPILHTAMKGALLTLLPPRCVLIWRSPRHHSWGYVFQDCFPPFKTAALLNRQVPARKHNLLSPNEMSDSGCNPIWFAHWIACPRDCWIYFRQ